MVYWMLLCDVQLINACICRPLDLLVAGTTLEKKTPSARAVPSGGRGAPRVLLRSAGDWWEGAAGREAAQLSATLSTATDAAARLLSYDARDKTFRPYPWTQLPKCSSIYWVSAAAGFFGWVGWMTRLYMYRPGHSWRLWRQRAMWLKGGSSCWQNSPSFLRRTSWNANG